MQSFSFLPPVIQKDTNQNTQKHKKHKKKIYFVIHKYCRSSPGFRNCILFQGGKYSVWGFSIAQSQEETIQKLWTEYCPTLYYDFFELTDQIHQQLEFDN